MLCPMSTNSSASLSVEKINSNIVFVDGGDAGNPPITPQNHIQQKIPIPKKNQVGPRAVRKVIVLSVCWGDLHMTKDHIVNPHKGFWHGSAPTQILLVL